MEFEYWIELLGVESFVSGLRERGMYVLELETT